MKYRTEYILKLQSKAVDRFDALQRALPVPYDNGEVMINGRDIRLAVDDFKSILAEIRKLK